MARSSSNSLLNSLRGKIWISTSVLAFFICTFGLVSYLVVTLITNNPFYGIFIPFLLIAFSVIVFGWWLSNELISPIEKVTLLAKSLERNSSTSLPKTSGSTETDQLLQTLHRNSQQTQNIVTLMDKVANGNLDITLTPLKGSDRLTASFQKLLSKVSESINAKEELTKLEQEIEQIKFSVTGIISGKLDADIKTDNFKTREITETLRYLLDNLVRLIAVVKLDSNTAQDSASEVEKTIESLIKGDENMIREMDHASITLKQVPNLIEKIIESLSSSAKSAKKTIEKARHGSEISQMNSEAVSKIRSKMRTSVSKIQNLNERSHEIAKVARTVEDLANRTNMIALNASIQATAFGEDGRGFVLVAAELERLAARAGGTNKQISMLNSTILSEIGKVESDLEDTMGEVANLSKFAIETSNVISELERYIGQYLGLQEKLIDFSNDKSEDTDKAFIAFGSSVRETEGNIKHLTRSSTEAKKITELMKSLHGHTAEFRLAAEDSGGNLSGKSTNSPLTQVELTDSRTSEMSEMSEISPTISGKIMPDDQSKKDFDFNDFINNLDIEELRSLEAASHKTVLQENMAEEIIKVELDFDNFESGDFIKDEVEFAMQDSSKTDTNRTALENPADQDKSAIENSDQQPEFNSKISA